jgi:threonine aldolase
MRQAGIVAAAGLYALDHNVARLADDHARAARLADGWRAAGLDAHAETNFVALDATSLGITTVEARERIAAQGVLAGTLRPGVVRLATYLGIEDEHVEQAVEAIPRALGARARV